MDQGQWEESNRKLFPRTAFCVGLWIAGAICLLGAGVSIYDFDPNAVVFPYATSDGTPSIDPAMTNFVGGYSAEPFYGIMFPTSFQMIFGCEKIVSSFNRNTSYLASSSCRIFPNQLKQDGQGTGQYGDAKGFTYPGAPNQVVCGQYMAPSSTEVCAGPNGCPNTDAIKYQGNDVYLAILYAQCTEAQAARPMLIASGVIVLSTALLAAVWLYFVKKADVLANPIGYVLNSLSIISFFFVTVASFYFFSATGIYYLNSLMNCAAMSSAEYYSASAIPNTDCFVTNATCDPFDFTNGGYFTGDTVGMCTYQTDQFKNIVCSDASANAPSTVASTPITSCDAIDCYFDEPLVGALYTSECCQYRRKCCGNEATCTDVCQWSNTTLTLTQTGAKIGENVCYNQDEQNIHACNNNQSTAFNENLRSTGICFPTTYGLAADLQTVSGPQATSAKCRSNDMNRLIEAGTHFGSTTQDSDLSKITRALITANLPQCLVQQYFPGCGTPCLGHAAAGCSEISPGVGAPANCTFVDTVCKPVTADYSTAALQAERPAEYCESLYDGTSAATITSSQTACLASSLCFWANVALLGGGRCFAKACSASLTTSHVGYAPTLTPPCVAITSKTTSGFIPPTVQICEFPDKGCTIATELPVCSLSRSFDAGYYYNDGPDTFSPGTVFDLSVCSILSAANCTAPAILSPTCVLIQGATAPQCVSVYTQCPSGQITNTYNVDVAEAQRDTTNGDLGGANCYTDINGNFISPIHYQLYLIQVFYVRFCFFLSSSMIGTHYD
jgi:hypothetical protein